MSCEKNLRKSLLVGVYMLGVLGILASSGGGSDDDDDDEIIISASYDFQIGGLLEDASNSAIDVEQDAGVSVTIEPDLQGELICDQNTEICELQFVYIGSRININDRTMPEFVGDIEVTVEDDWLYSPLGTDQPVAGRFRVVEAGEPPIVVEFTDCQGSNDSEVQVTVDPGGPADTVNCYSWDNFEDLFTTGTITERQASFGWEAAEFFVLGLALDALEVFPLIIDGDFAGGNPLNEVCESYPGTWMGGPPSPGNFTFFWDDDSQDSQVGAGDSFRQTFADCWFGDSTEGALFDGGIDYIGYTQVVQNQLYTRIGFEQAAQGSGKIGGVSLDSLEITETNEAGGIITPEPKLTLNGSYLIAFFR